jgi:quercetin dioxygenase-like cupin family protein
MWSKLFGGGDGLPREKVDAVVHVIDRHLAEEAELRRLQGRCQCAWGRCAACENVGDAKGGITDMSDEKACSPEDSLEIHRPVQAFDAVSEAKRLREEKTYEDHGRSVLSLFHGPSLRAMLTAIATGRRTGERRVAGPSIVHVLEGEVRFQAGEERHVLSAGGTLVLEGNVPYEAEALSEAAFLHTLVRSTEEDKSLPQSAHSTEPAEARADLDLPGADHAS